MKDYQSLTTTFSPERPDPAGSAGLETSITIRRFNYTAAGDAYLESLLFAYGRHLFISSSRENSPPPYLQKVNFSTLLGLGRRLPFEH